MTASSHEISMSFCIRCQATQPRGLNHSSEKGKEGNWLDTEILTADMIFFVSKQKFISVVFCVFRYINAWFEKAKDKWRIKSRMDIAAVFCFYPPLSTFFYPYNKNKKDERHRQKPR